jgi:hypothetical protein
MANAVEKVNTIAIASIEAINTITDANLEALNTLEFTGVAPDAHTLISTHTASSSSSLDITSGIDSTYDVYEFHFVSIHPQSGEQWSFQVNAAGESGFNETMTTTFVRAYHNEGDTSTVLEYQGALDQAQGTAYQLLSSTIGNDADQAMSGVLTLYGPSSTTYVKHFIATSNTITDDDYSSNGYIAGYINTTAAIDEISFKMTSGNIDSGVIRMYGLAKP